MNFSLAANKASSTLPLANTSHVLQLHINFVTTHAVEQKKMRVITATMHV